MYLIRIAEKLNRHLLASSTFEYNITCGQELVFEDNTIYFTNETVRTMEHVKRKLMERVGFEQYSSSSIAISSR